MKRSKVEEDSLRFFGAMSASVSHEIRNKLAVINEKAGLIGDMAASMKVGRAVDPDRLAIQATKIVEQIREANGIVKTLNRLAHSTDEVVSVVELGELVSLVVELYGRKAAIAQATLEYCASGDDIRVRTSPFLVATALGRCLDLALDRPNETRALTVSIEAAEDGGRITVDGTAEISAGASEVDDLRAGIAALLVQLNAELSADPERGGLVLLIRTVNRQINGSDS